MDEPVALTQYLEQAKVEELRREWESKGYRVIPNGRIGDYRPDLMVVRDDETIVFEVKTSGSLVQEREQVRQLARLIRQKPKTTFHLVVANPPRARRIDIEGVEDRLQEYMAENFPSELDELSTHTRVESVDDVEVTDVQIRPGEIRAVGSGVVEVELQYGSASDLASDEGLLTHESFTFQFDLVLSGSLTIKAVNRLEVDTSPFYE